MGWDPGSEIRDPEKTYSGSWIQGSKRHCIPCIKFASAGNRTWVPWVTGRHSTYGAIKTAYTRVADPGSFSQIPDPDF